MHGSDQEARYGVLPQVEKAWNFPLFEAIVGRRSRRFGFGMELSHGPFSYKSDKEPVPLDEAETAMLVAAATGVTGAILCEGEFQGGMVKSVGRPHPSAVGSHRTELFFTNDDGVFLMVMPRILMGEGSLRKKHPSPIIARGSTELPSPARGPQGERAP